MNGGGSPVVPKTRDVLREAREQAKLTQAQAAQLAGYKTKSSWAMVELGYNTPSVQQMKTMAAVVGKRPSEVFAELREEGEYGEQATGA